MYRIYGTAGLAAENELGDEAYWTTYQEDFQELMGLYLMNHLNQVIQELERERAEEYASFGQDFWDACGAEKRPGGDSTAL